MHEGMIHPRCRGAGSAESGMTAHTLNTSGKEKYFHEDTCVPVNEGHVLE